MINFRVKTVPFEALSLHELYKIMVLRQEVFVVEQNCPFLDADGKDLKAYHLMILNENDELLAYTRLLDRGVAYENHVSIGRVVSSKSVRGTNLGRQLMQLSIDACKELFGNVPNKIGAQLYLKKFYESFGFVQSSEPYDEDGIMHIEMVLRA